MKYETQNQPARTRSAAWSEFLPLMVVGGWMVVVASFFVFFIQRGF